MGHFSNSSGRGAEATCLNHAFAKESWTECPWRTLPTWRSVTVVAACAFVWFGSGSWRWAFRTALEALGSTSLPGSFSSPCPECLWACGGDAACTLNCFLKDLLSWLTTLLSKSLGCFSALWQPVKWAGRTLFLVLVLWLPVLVLGNYFCNIFAYEIYSVPE